MKLPVSQSCCAIMVWAGLAFGVMLPAPAEARDPKAAVPQVTGPAGDYPVQIGDPFLIDGVTYTPADTLNYDAVGKAVLADPGSGAPRISGAHRTLPVPSYVEVTSLDSGRTILVRLDQRGPMDGDGLVALSPMAWSQLGLPASGSAPVRVRRVNPPEQERALLRTGQTAPLRMDTPPGLLAALKRKLGVEPPVGDLPLTVKPAEVVALSAKPPVAPSQPAAHKPLPVVKPAAKPATKAKSKSESEPKPEPKPEAPANPKPAPAAAARPEPAPVRAETHTSGTTRFYVQIGAFAQRANADAAARKAGGTLVRVGTLWRVRSGPFSTGTEADSALAKARSAGYAGARTVRE